MPLKKGQSVRSAAMGRLVDLAGGRDGTQKSKPAAAKGGNRPAGVSDAAKILRDKKNIANDPDVNLQRPNVNRMRGK